MGTLHGFQSLDRGFGALFGIGPFVEDSAVRADDGVVSGHGTDGADENDIVHAFIDGLRRQVPATWVRTVCQASLSLPRIF